MDTPAIAHLVGAYFHQDWADDFAGDPQAAVDAFIAGTPDLAPRLPAEIDQVLAELTDDAAIEAYLESLGCEYTPVPNETYGSWLNEIALRVAASYPN